MNRIQRLRGTKFRTLSLGGYLWLLVAALTHTVVGCDSAVACGDQGNSKQPVDGCLDLFDCEAKSCKLTFRECDDGVERGYDCVGDTCTCFGGPAGTCTFTQDRCPGVDIDITGDGTDGMKQYEDCCGEAVQGD